MTERPLKNKHHICSKCFDCIHDCQCEQPRWFYCGDPECGCVSDAQLLPQPDLASQG